MFALANSNYQDSDYVIIGIQIDISSSYRAGTVDGPDSIRKASYCFEPYMMEYETSLKDIYIHDKGNLKFNGDIEDIGEFGNKIKNVIGKIISDGKFPIIIGGEHSISPFSLSGLERSYENIDVCVFDAHLDYREEYEGLKNSHATSVKRMAELEFIDNIAVFGVRSISIEESIEDKPYFLTPENINQISGDELHSNFGQNPIYLSIDMDVFDTCFAPGVGNPEPFGINPTVVKEFISKYSSNLAGMDIVEVNPKFDPSEITSHLSARLIYELIGSRESGRS